jgi:hypothetical protein
MRRTIAPPRRARGGTAVLALAAAFALAASPAAAQQRGPVTLRLGGEGEEASTYRFEQEISLRMPQEFGGPQQVKSLLVLEQRVEDVEADTIRYRTEVLDVSVDMESDPTGGGLDFSQFEGQRFQVSMTRRGDILGLAGGGSGAEQLQQTIRQVGFPLLPRRPVSVGDTWVDTTRVDAAAMALPADGDIVSVNRATLEAITREGDTTVASLAVETRFHFEPGPRATPGMSVQLNGARTDDVRFDVGRGRFLSASGRQAFTLNMGIAGAGASLSIQGEARSQARLVR